MGPEEIKVLSTMAVVIWVFLIILAVMALLMPIAVWRIRKESIKQTEILNEHTRLFARLVNIGLDHTNLLVKEQNKGNVLELHEKQ